MQNNVKRKLLSAAVSLTVFLMLVFTLCLPSSATVTVDVAPSEQVEFKKTEADGVVYVGEQDFFVKDYNYTTNKGGAVSISVGAYVDTEVSITVYYASGASTSSVFVPKTATPTEDAVWEWKLHPNVSLPEIRIVLRSESCYAQLYITVI